MSIYTKIKETSISLDTYNQNWMEKTNLPMKGLSVDERKQLMHRKYNSERREETLKRFEPSNELNQLLTTLTHPIYWYVITEDWCGDSSYNLAVIEAISLLSENIQLRIVERDKDTTIIDQFLTNGGRAIPILLSYDENEELMFKWGPRPQNQIEYRKSLVEQGLEKLEITNKVIEAYSNGAWKNVETEVFQLLKSSI